MKIFLYHRDFEAAPICLDPHVLCTEPKGYGDKSWGDRPVLTHIIRSLKQFDRLVVPSLSTISCHPVELADVLGMINRRGAEVESASLQFILHEETAEGLIAGLQTSIECAKESRAINKRAKELRGMRGKTPPGYKKIRLPLSKKTAFVVDQKQVDLWWDIWLRNKRGERMKDIAKSLNRRGSRTPQGLKWTEGKCQRAVNKLLEKCKSGEFFGQQLYCMRDQIDPRDWQI